MYEALSYSGEELEVMREKASAAEAKVVEMQVAYKEVEESYKKEMQLRKKYYNQIEDMKGAPRSLLRLY